MKKFLAVTTLLFATFTQAANANTINFGINATYAPFEFINEKNEVVGFDIDIANKICETLKVKCKFTDQAFDSLIPSLKTRRIDATISGIDITEERLKQIDFTQSYFDNSAKFMVNKKTNFNSSKDLNNKKIGIQNGTTHQKFIIEKFPNLKVVNYDDYQNAMIDLKSQRIDAIFCDSAVADEWLTKESNITTLKEKIVDPKYFGSGLGIAVRKGNKKLLTQLNNALTKIKANGSYNAIYNKWFDDKK